MALRAVTFDLWETLIADSPQQNHRRTAHRIQSIGKLLAGAGLEVPAEDLEVAHQGIWTECSRSWERAVDLPFERQVSLFLDLARPGLSSEVHSEKLAGIAGIYAEAVLLYPPSLIPGATVAVSELKARGIKIGLICNTGRTPGCALRRLLSDFGILGLFDAAFFSDETIFRKPDPRIFRLALEALGAAPDDSVHVGDSLENDVRGALGAGMRAVWINTNAERCSEYTPNIQTVADLREVLF